MKTRFEALAVAAALLGTPLAGWSADPAPPAEASAQAVLGEYVILGWNDLGMHCMNDDFEGLAILPPYNNLWAQVIRRGSPPSLVSEGVRIEYRFPENTESASKVNFWDYEDKLFGVDLPLNVGLTGNGLTGEMEWNGTAWEATGVPITPFNDAAPTVEQPYQLAELTLKNLAGEVLDVTTIVAPVSAEIHCDSCHDTIEDKASDGRTAVDPGIVWRAILTKHDKDSGTSLMENTPVLCASCHSSNALGTPGVPGVLSLSESIHRKHGEKFPTLDCYACHPGQQTQCLRGAMHLAGKTCVDCHGTLIQVAESIAEGRRPWLDEPKCGTCHPAQPENAGQLYRNSTHHHGVYCAACHGSPHAELPTAQPRDGLQAVRVQGSATPIGDCAVCHTSAPTSAGPHGIAAPSGVVDWDLFQRPAG